MYILPIMVEVRMKKEVMKLATCCLVGGVVFAGSMIYSKAAEEQVALPSAGVSLAFSECYTTPKNITTEKDSNTAEETSETAKEEDTTKKEETVKSEYADIAIAQVDNYVNIRAAADEESEVVGKLYNNSAATVQETEGDWYKITSGSVTGYVKSEFVVRDNEELAKAVGRRVAVVNTETLRVRNEADTESGIVGLVPIEEELTVTEENDGWVKVSIDEGEGYVSQEYVECKTIFVTAESKEEEEARLAKEEAERQRAAEAAQEAQSSSDNSSSQGSSSTPASTGGGNGQAVADFACQFIGNPYVYGGTSLTNGADCSGFVMSVYANFGVSLPHSSSALAGVGYGVSYDQAQPGDIICYSGHVGIYIGGGQIVNASSSETGIKTQSATYREIVAVRRIF